MSEAGARPVLCVGILNTWYGLDAERVLEVTPAATVTPVPGAPRFVLGVTNIKGQLAPVLDAGLRFGIEASPGSERPLVFVRHGEGVSALVVDRVTDLVSVDAHDIQPPPAVLSTSETNLYKGIVRVGSHLVALVDSDAVLDIPCDDAAPGNAWASSTPQLPAHVQDNVHKPARNSAPYLFVEVAGARFCVEAAAVVEVLRDVDIEHQDDVPDHVLGFVDHRLGITAAVSLRKRFGLPGNDGESLFVVCEPTTAPCAFAVDHLLEIEDVDDDDFNDAPDPMVVGGLECVKKLLVREENDQVIAVIDPQQILGTPHLQEMPPAREETNMAASEPHDAVSAEEEVIEFRLGVHRLAFRTEHVLEVQKTPNISFVPFAPSFFRGVFHLRGQVIPMLDLLRRFDIATDGSTTGNLVIVVNTPKTTFGVLADTLCTIQTIPTEEIHQPPPEVRGFDGCLLGGIFAGHDGESVLLLEPDLLPSQPGSASTGPQST